MRERERTAECETGIEIYCLKFYSFFLSISFTLCLYFGKNLPAWVCVCARERTMNKYHLITCDMICKELKKTQHIIYLRMQTRYFQMIGTIGMPMFVFHNSDTFYFVAVHKCRKIQPVVVLCLLILQSKFHKNPFSLNTHTHTQKTKTQNKQIKYYYLFSIHWHTKRVIISFNFCAVAVTTGPNFRIKYS